MSTPQIGSITTTMSESAPRIQSHSAALPVPHRKMTAQEYMKYRQSNPKLEQPKLQSSEVPPQLGAVQRQEVPGTRPEPNPNSKKRAFPGDFVQKRPGPAESPKPEKKAKVKHDDHSAVQRPVKTVDKVNHVSPKSDIRKAASETHSIGSSFGSASKTKSTAAIASTAAKAEPAPAAVSSTSRKREASTSCMPGTRTQKRGTSSSTERKGVARPVPRKARKKSESSSSQNGTASVQPEEKVKPDSNPSATKEPTSKKEDTSKAPEKKATTAKDKVITNPKLKKVLGKGGPSAASRKGQSSAARKSTTTSARVSGDASGESSLTSKVGSEKEVSNSKPEPSPSLTSSSSTPESSLASTASSSMLKDVSKDERLNANSDSITAPSRGPTVSAKRKRNEEAIGAKVTSESSSASTPSDTASCHGKPTKPSKRAGGSQTVEPKKEPRSTLQTSAQGDTQGPTETIKQLRDNLKDRDDTIDLQKRLIELRQTTIKQQAAEIGRLRAQLKAAGLPIESDEPAGPPKKKPRTQAKPKPKKTLTPVLDNLREKGGLPAGPSGLKAEESISDKNKPAPQPKPKREEIKDRSKASAPVRTTLGEKKDGTIAARELKNEKVSVVSKKPAPQPEPEREEIKKGSKPSAPLRTTPVKKKDGATATPEVKNEEPRVFPKKPAPSPAKPHIKVNKELTGVSTPTVSVPPAQKDIRTPTPIKSYHALCASTNHSDRATQIYRNILAEERLQALGSPVLQIFVPDTGRWYYGQHKVKAEEAEAEHKLDAEEMDIDADDEAGAKTDYAGLVQMFDEDMKEGVDVDKKTLAKDLVDAFEDFSDEDSSDDENMKESADVDKETLAKDPVAAFEGPSDEDMKETADGDEETLARDLVAAFDAPSDDKGELKDVAVDHGMRDADIDHDALTQKMVDAFNAPDEGDDSDLDSQFGDGDAATPSEDLEESEEE